MSDYMEETGDPFTGKKKEELKKFLEYMGLTYDEQITHSIVLRKEKEIIATASCQKNIIKCVAVSEEGQVWEAAMTASKYKLDNLCVIVDNNNLQIDGTIEDVKGLQNIEGKFESFGFNVITVNGNNIADLITAFDKSKMVKGKPTAIVAITTKGKGISFMENKVEWHGKAPNEEQYNIALEELK